MWIEVCREFAFQRNAVSLTASVLHAVLRIYELLSGRRCVGVFCERSGKGSKHEIAVRVGDLRETFR